MEDSQVAWKKAADAAKHAIELQMAPPAVVLKLFLHAICLYILLFVHV